MSNPTNLLTLSSGLESLDQVLEGPQWGDTVILHVRNVREYCLFLNPIADFLKAQGIPYHCISVREKSIPYRPESPSSSIYDLSHLGDLGDLGRELSKIMTQNGPSNFYIFDNIAELVKVSTLEDEIIDLVQEISLRVSERRAAAYVAVQKGFLSNALVAQIRDTASIFLDVWSLDNSLYFQPIKVQGRYSEKMFQRYQLVGGQVYPTSGVDFEEYARTLEIKSKEFLELYSQKRSIEKDLQKKIFELSLINNISSSLLSTMNLEEILYRILIGVTAKEGLGFNRAFLLLVNDTEKVLEGKMAIGPSSLEEALRIWTDLNERHPTFSELLANFDEGWRERDTYVNQIVRKIRVPLSDRTHLFIELLKHMQPEIIAYEIPFHHYAEDILRLLEVQSFAAVPLPYRGRCLGLLLADNLITQKPITREDVNMLETFANYASSAIEHSRLYEEVRIRIKESERHIHELEAMQDRLMRSKKLSELGELASKMAHEIRTPLVSIGGFANTMLKAHQPESADHEYLKIIVDEVRRLEDIITNVLAYVSPGIPKTKPTDLNALLEHVIFLMNVPLRKKKIDVVTHCSEDLGPLAVDPDQMKQVFTAIINNAIESMSEGGKLEVSTARHNDFVRISISDTGIGIAEDKLDKVFDAFFTTKSTGSGLGLNIASQIVANHKGSIYVESQVGVGSTFIINLPFFLT
jgi:signal transduction histidine kinase